LRAIGLMLQRLLAWLRLNWARNALADGFRVQMQGGSWLAAEVELDDLRKVVERGGPQLAPYERLAREYDSYGDRRRDLFPNYLRALAAYRGQPCERVLDLACGTGSIVRELAKRSSRVVGVDRSPAMLAAAREACRDLPNVGFAEGDIRSLELNEQFDAALCTNDSLNYVQQPGELQAVFAAAGRHLRPGGLLAFDCLPELAFQRLHGRVFHHIDDDARFAMTFRYDQPTRRGVAQVIFPDGIERHERIPLEPSDVGSAASAAGFEVIDDFYSQECRYFFALQKA